jgi:hypothetical protein
MEIQHCHHQTSHQNDIESSHNLIIWYDLWFI